MYFAVPQRHYYVKEFVTHPIIATTPTHSLANHVGIIYTSTHYIQNITQQQVVTNWPGYCFNNNKAIKW
jgi:hypothetical protein